MCKMSPVTCNNCVKVCRVLFNQTQLMSQTFIHTHTHTHVFYVSFKFIISVGLCTTIHAVLETIYYIKLSNAVCTTTTYSIRL